MIVSRFVHLFKTAKDVPLAFSSRHNSLLKLSENDYEALLRWKSGECVAMADIEEATLCMLREQGIVCDECDDNDYVSRCKFVTQSKQHDKSTLSLVIVPTLDCNLHCPYCFEKAKRHEKISDCVIDHIIRFINNNDCKWIDLKWYGGEPILALRRIRIILQRLHTECEKHLIQHSIITNGTLFDEQAIELFTQYPLDLIQFTLDGVKSRHDRLRCTKEGKLPTFDTVLQNIKNTSESLPLTRIDVRVNIDKTNVDDFLVVKRMLDDMHLQSAVTVYPGFIRYENEYHTNLESPSFQRNETLRLLYSLQSDGVIKGDPYPERIKEKTCGALCANSFIVGPRGEIYKCWNDVSDKTKVVGNICDLKMSNPRLYYRYQEDCAWYNDQECTRCFFLPLCNGKCAWYNMRNIYHGGEYELCQCVEKVPGMLNAILERYYENSMEN